jgi:hypothetical protein
MMPSECAADRKKRWVFPIRKTIERLGQNLPADHGMDVIDPTGKLVVPAS